MELTKAINSRHSCRSFKLKKPKYKDIIEAIDSALKAPLAGNLPTLKFILVSDKNKIKQLADAAVQRFIEHTKYLVVVCSDTTQCQRAYHERSEKYCRQQAGAAIQNFLLKITELKLATCWVGAFSDIVVKRILEIPENIDIEALLPIGYEQGKAKQKKKPNPDTSIFFDKYKNKYMKPLETEFEPQ